ncbi:MAG: Glu/Leu/Phe/Val dehydrogenase dimerization domain-containing protein [Brachybacterium sp.]|nr:Glu/Leu/Phe/Val dehydrogenase dimerization domain-containing protein [Brachybacterium sp.]
MSRALPLPDFTHERVVIETGPRSGLVIAVALHSSALGQALGGCRMWPYPQWDDALGDVLRLSSAMTLKNAAAGLDAGGGKSVIALRPGERIDEGRRRAALLDLGDIVESFGGSYRTAEDVGTTEDDMVIVRERTEHVVGTPLGLGGAGEPAGPTSLGVYSSVAPTLLEATGSGEIAGRRIVISGLGQVGGRLARLLAADGAELLITDIDTGKQTLAEELGATWIDASEALSTEADVFIPAGIGGILTDEAIAGLMVQAVVGPANNPLAERDGAAQLAARGIVYAPDFVVNAGGVIYLTLAADGVGQDEIDARVRGIGDTLTMVYQDARDRQVTPLAAAEDLAYGRISTADATS